MTPQDFIVAAMAIIAALELAIPLQPRKHWNKAHLAPNLTLTAIYFAISLLFCVFR